MSSEVDKQAQEQIRVAVISATDTNMTVDEAVEYIVRELEQLGYRKLPEGQPPLLSDNPYIYESEECRQHTAFDKGKRAQREADIEWYERG